jgi:hypothetical protein
MVENEIDGLRPSRRAEVDRQRSGSRSAIGVMLQERPNGRNQSRRARIVAGIRPLPGRGLYQHVAQILGRPGMTAGEAGQGEGTEREHVRLGGWRPASG